MAWKKTTSVFKDYEDSDIEPIFTKVIKTFQGSINLSMVKRPIKKRGKLAAFGVVCGVVVCGGV